MSVRWRLTIFNALVIGAILVLLGLALFFTLRETLLSSVEETAQSRAFTAAQAIVEGEGLEEEDGRIVLDDDLVTGLTLDGVFITVRDGEGDIITRTVNLTEDRTSETGAWSLALDTNRPSYEVGEMAEDGRLDYIYAVPVEPGSGPARVVEAGKSYGTAQENLQRVAQILVIGISIALLLSIIGAYLLALAALSPVAAVVVAARRITNGGDLSERLPVPSEGSRDEITDLTATMNVMLSRLEGAFRKQEETIERQRRFAADASHELRTPLTSIDGYAEILEDWGLTDSEIGPESVVAIRRETARMRELVESLLLLTRGDEGAPMNLRVQSISEVVEESVEAARAAASGKVEISCEPSGTVPELPFDRDRIRQVLTILLDNAVKYTAPGGRIRVTTRKTATNVEVAVSDTGRGIPESALPHLFERFYRVDEARSGGEEDGGAGLGLAIADQISTAHEGEIRVSSKPGSGSTFTFVLPLGGGESRDTQPRQSEKARS